MPKVRRYRSRSPAILISRLIAALICVALFAVPARAEEPATKSEPAIGPAYMRLDPIFVPIIQGNQVTQQVGVTLMLQIIEGKSKSDIEAKRKQLYDAFFRELYGFFQSPAAAGGNVDQTYLKVRLLKIAVGVVGPNLVQEVLIEQLFERPK